MPSISDRVPAVTVEYDSRNKRVAKHFDDPSKARRFYAQKLKDGRNPTVQGEQARQATDKAPTQAPTPTANKTTPNATRPYVAGLVVKKYGVAKGITAEMVAEVDAIYGKANPRESKFTLRYAVDAIRAFTTP